MGRRPEKTSRFIHLIVGSELRGGSSQVRQPRSALRAPALLARGLILPALSLFAFYCFPLSLVYPFLPFLCRKGISQSIMFNMILIHDLRGLAKGIIFVFFCIFLSFHRIKWRHAWVTICMITRVRCHLSLQWLSSIRRHSTIVVSCTFSFQSLSRFFFSCWLLDPPKVAWITDESTQGTRDSFIIHILTHPPTSLPLHMQQLLHLWVNFPHF